MKRYSLLVCCLLVGGLAGVFVAGPLLNGQAPVTPALPRELTSYRDVVKKVLPAVVSIESRTKAAPAGSGAGVPPIDEEVPEEFRRFFEFDGDDAASAARRLRLRLPRRCQGRHPDQLPRRRGRQPGQSCS